MAAPFRPRRDDAPPPRRRKRATPSGDRRTLPPELTQAQRGVRLQKAMADAGVAARRDCEEMILQGRVTVNGQVVAAMPAWVDPTSDRIEVDGQPLRRLRPERATSEKIYVLLNKTRGVITTTEDPDHRKTVTDMVELPPGFERRLFPVGRLDADSSGLILLTNDGDLANHLTHPRYGVPKQYAVSVRGRLTQEDILSLKEGIHLAHLTHDDDDSPTVKRATMANVELIGYGTDRNNNQRTRLLVTLREGQNREIRRMIAHLGHKVRRLERVAIGPLTSRGLGAGQWRFLTAKEVTQLQKLASRPPVPGPGSVPMRMDKTSGGEAGRPAPRAAIKPPYKPAVPGQGKPKGKPSFNPSQPPRSSAGGPRNQGGQGGQISRGGPRPQEGRGGQGSQGGQRGQNNRGGQGGRGNQGGRGSSRPPRQGGRPR